MTILDFSKRLGHGLIVGFLAFGSLLYAQESATMVGTATDTSGAAVPNTKIVIVNESTAADVRDTVTNAAGIYSAPEPAAWSLHAPSRSSGLLEVRAHRHRSRCCQHSERRRLAGG